MAHQLKLMLLALLLHTASQAQQISTQVLNSSGTSSSANGLMLEYAVGGLTLSTINTPTFMYTQDFLQPDAGTTNTAPFINDVKLDGLYGIDNAGTTFVSGNNMVEFTLGEMASITLNSANNMLTQGILQPYHPPANTQLYLILYLEGYYTGSYAMEHVLLNQSVSTNASIVDTIEVELHPAGSPSVVAAIAKTLLYTNGLANCSFTVNTGNYYIVIKHRNTIETWSAIPYQFNSAPVLLDFSYEAQRAYGNNQVEVEPGVWAIYSGDLNADENIDLLDLGMIETDINAFQSGHFATDINGDGNVDLLDAPTVETNINEFIYSVHPQ